MTHKNGCFDRPPFKPHYLPTGAPDTMEYRIPHVFTQDCQYSLSDLGSLDDKCSHCQWKQTGAINAYAK